MWSRPVIPLQTELDEEQLAEQFNGQFPSSPPSGELYQQRIYGIKKFSPQTDWQLCSTKTRRSDCKGVKLGYGVARIDRLSVSIGLKVDPI